MARCLLTVQGVLWLVAAGGTGFLLLFVAAAVANRWVRAATKERHHG